MMCQACQKLALLPSPKQCISCPRFCDFREQKWCNFCSNVKGICAVCAKPMEQKSTIDPGQPNMVKKNQAEKIHPFFGNKSRGGCRSCGG